MIAKNLPYAAPEAALEELGNGKHPGGQQEGNEQPDQEREGEDVGPFVHRHADAVDAGRADHADEVLGADVGGDERTAHNVPGQAFAGQKVLFAGGPLLAPCEVADEGEDGKKGAHGQVIQGTQCHGAGSRHRAGKNHRYILRLLGLSRVSRIAADFTVVNSRTAALSPRGPRNLVHRLAKAALDQVAHLVDVGLLGNQGRADREPVGIDAENQAVLQRGPLQRDAQLAVRREGPPRAGSSASSTPQSTPRPRTSRTTP